MLRTTMRMNSKVQLIVGVLLLISKTLHSEQIIAYNSTPTRLASEVSYLIAFYNAQKLTDDFIGKLVN